MPAAQSVSALLGGFDESSETVERMRQATLAGATDEESFHQLRVAIKRLRSLAEVVSRIDPQFDAGKRLRRLRPLFRAAGRVRDRQLHEKRLQSLLTTGEPALTASSPEVEEALSRFLRAAARADTTNLFALRSKIEKTLSPLSDGALAPLIGAAWLTMLDEIAMWERGEDRTDLHSLRILAKRAHHALFLIQSMFPDARIDQHAAEHLDHVQKLLGTWHDDEVALAHLESWTESSAAVDRARQELQQAKTKLATSAMSEYRRLRTRILKNRPRLITIEPR